MKKMMMAVAAMAVWCAVAEVPYDTDSDGDGLIDSDEESYGTAASMFDTDNDGMPDGWEAVFAGTDPTLSDGEEVGSGDVMAYAQVTGTLITVWQYGDAASKDAYILFEGAAVPQVGDPINGLVLYSKYKYGDVYGIGLPTNAPIGYLVYSIEKDIPIALVHAQVYRRFGFNPKTANPVVAESNRINTKPFTARDKYLTLRYFAAFGLADEQSANMNHSWSGVSLKPYDSDNDKDGLPDGWELYTMFGNGNIPTVLSDCKISPFNYSDARTQAPGDSKKTVLELYNSGTPSDPWGGGSEKENPSTNALTQTSICLTITNVVLHYVVPTYHSDVVSPVTSETGFVNVITEIKGGNVAVPDSWATNYPNFVSRFGRDFTKALMMPTKKKDGANNPMLVWQDYVAGTDPTKEDDVFKASITRDGNGKIIISHTPEFKDANEKGKRKYTTLGKKSLMDSADWEVVPEGHEADYNFFKVTVEMKP